MKNPTMTKGDLMALGYGNGESTSYIAKAKRLMVEKGYSYYKNPRLARVPVYVLEELFGYDIPTPQMQVADVVDNRKSVNNPVLTKYDLLYLGYGTGQVESLMHQAKQLMVEKGFDYYLTQTVSRVPASAFEEILGFMPPAVPDAQVMVKQLRDQRAKKAQTVRLTQLSKEETQCQ
jgi:hypothetical protein